MWWGTAQYFGFCCLLSGWIYLLLKAGFALCGSPANPAHSLLQALCDRQRSRSVCNLRQFHLLLLPLALFSTLYIYISQPWGKMPLPELQNGGLVTPWKDKQQSATGVCGIKTTLTLRPFFSHFWYSCTGTEVTKASVELVILFWNETQWKLCAEDCRITVWPQNNACDHGVLQEYLFKCMMGVGLFCFCKETSMSFLYCSLNRTASLFFFMIAQMDSCESNVMLTWHFEEANGKKI